MSDDEVKALAKALWKDLDKGWDGIHSRQEEFAVRLIDVITKNVSCTIAKEVANSLYPKSDT